MAWKVEIKDTAIRHLQWFGKGVGRNLLQESLKHLPQDPLAETRNLKTLRPNPIAQRELRILGKYRVLFSVDVDAERVTILLIGEKRGNRLVVEGREFEEHHEGHSSE